MKVAAMFVAGVWIIQAAAHILLSLLAVIEWLKGICWPG